MNLTTFTHSTHFVLCSILAHSKCRAIALTAVAATAFAIGQWPMYLFNKLYQNLNLPEMRKDEEKQLKIKTKKRRRKRTGKMREKKPII